MREDGRAFRPVGSVNNTFTLEKEGASCGPLQQLRELTQNGLEAILATGGGGTVTWDVDLHRARATRGRQRKLTVIDDGTGLTGPQMVHYFGNLAASGRRQARDANFGMGAKIALYYPNPHGIIWRSWHNGNGAEVHARRFHTADGPAYGLELLDTLPDGTQIGWRPLTDSDRPRELADGRDGTQVILLGQDDEDDTSVAPTTVRLARRRWITRYLNTRFFTLPDGIAIRVREGHHHNSRNPTLGDLVAVKGQARLLAEHAERTGGSGVVDLDHARAHWWLLTPARRGTRDEAAPWASTGHLAVLHAGELYAMLAPTEGGYATLQNSFGIRAGYDRVVIYIEPDDQLVDIDIKRTHLTIAGNDPPWDAWGTQFRERMPAPLRTLQDQAPTAETVIPSIRQRLQQHAQIYLISAYRPPRAPSPPPAAAASNGNGSPADDDSNRLTALAPASAADAHAGSPAEQPAAHAAAAGPSTAAAAQNGGTAPPGVADPGRPVGGELPAATNGDARSAPQRTRTAAIELPKVRWVSVKDDTRAPGELEDLAARYDHREDLLTINADFRVFTDMIKRWTTTYTGTPGATATITTAVREAFAQSLIETILTARAIEGTSTAWPAPDADHAAESPLLTPQALSVSVLPRQLIDADLKKRLAQRLGKR